MFRAQKVKSLNMAIFDISRAHFMAPMDREACVELPHEDKLPEDGDAVGLLLRVYARILHSECKLAERWVQVTLEQAGYKVGVANTALFYSAEEGFRAHDEHWTGWARPYLASSTPWESLTDLTLGVTVSATLSC